MDEERLTPDQARTLSNIFGLARWLAQNTSLTPMEIGFAFLACGSAIIEQEDVEVDVVSLH